MRIALFTESYRPVINGVSVSVERLARELQQLGHQPTVITPRFPGYTDTKFDGINSEIPVLRLRSWRTPLNPENPFAYPPLLPPSILQHQHFDVVHSHQPFGMGLQGRAWARRLQIPCVSTFHTLYQGNAHYVPFLPASLVNHFVNRQLHDYYRSCDTVIVPSKAAETVLYRLGLPQTVPLRIIPTGIPDAPTVSEHDLTRTRARLGLPIESKDSVKMPILLYVGRMAREKNVGLLLAAFDILCTRLSKSDTIEPHLLLVGGGPETEYYRKQIRFLGLNNRVHCTGYIAPEEMASVYALATLFVFPSMGETQGIVIGEAQSHGLPVVLVHGGGSSEFVRDGLDALVVVPEPEPFADAITDLLTNPAKRHSFANTARFSLLRMTPEVMAQKTLTIYEECISAHPVN